VAKTDKTSDVTTTTAATGIDDIDEAAIAFDGEKASGGFDGPSWLPHFVEFADSVIKTKLEKVGAGSSTRKDLAGRVVIASAWGRRLYFIDVPMKDKTTKRVHVPEHTSLYGVLNGIELRSLVRISYVGRGKAKPGQTAPHLYDVTAEKGKILGTPRPDALAIMSKRELDDVPADDVQFP
jgi:hypothetical protein